MGYGSWGRKELDTTEATERTHTHTGSGQKPTQMGSQVLRFLPPLQGAALGLHTHTPCPGPPWILWDTALGAGSAVSDGGA